MKKIFSPNDFHLRREKLLELIKNKYPQITNGAIVLFANFEHPSREFIQDSSFYYYTGIEEPGSVLYLSLDSSSILFIPNFGNNRAHWIVSTLDANSKAKEFEFDEIKILGEQIKGYEFYPFFSKAEYSNLLSLIEDKIKSGGTIFTLNPDSKVQNFEQRFVLKRINQFLGNFLISISDISDLIAKMRRSKDSKEIEALYSAIDLTILGHEGAMQVLEAEKYENEIQAAIEYVFISGGGLKAFPSIIAGGKNAAILHYTANNKILNSNELMIVDIGAQVEHYCADISRTYPISGIFSKRQREVYELVLETQEYIASIAAPGMWLSNNSEPDNSLNHLAKKFLEEKGYEKYFVHGIGHFLGLDVHDVGNYLEPLAPGDIFTIEPGIYIPEEKIGVRIEDDYWMIEDSVICLSERLPKEPKEIEELLKK